MSTGEEAEASSDDLVAVARFDQPIYCGLTETGHVERGGKDDPYQVVINGENFHALESLLYCYEKKVDCIYIDPPYNTGAKDWKYNNNYVSGDDAYRHSKWLTFMGTCRSFVIQSKAALVLHLASYASRPLVLITSRPTNEGSMSPASSSVMCTYSDRPSIHRLQLSRSSFSISLALSLRLARSLRYLTIYETKSSHLSSGISLGSWTPRRNASRLAADQLV